MTMGVVCENCGIRNHTAAQCWTLHTELRPENYRKPVANLAIITDSAEDQNNDKKWEVEQLAREQRSKRYALEKNLDDTETEEQQEDENGELNQFMADFNTPPPEQDRDE